VRYRSPPDVENQGADASPVTIADKRRMQLLVGCVAAGQAALGVWRDGVTTCDTIHAKERDIFTVPHRTGQPDGSCLPTKAHTPAIVSEVETPADLKFVRCGHQPYALVREDIQGLGIFFIWFCINIFIIRLSVVVLLRVLRVGLLRQPPRQNVPWEPS
jgi:hypothetical protein